METILLGFAKKFGLGLLENIISKKLKGSVGDKIFDTVVDRVKDVVVKKTGIKTVEELQEKNEELIKKVLVEVNNEYLPEILSHHVESQKILTSLYKDEMYKSSGEKEHWFVWSWRPLGMYFIIISWSFKIFIEPLLKISPTIGATELLGFTTLYASLYMGGHTLKNIFGDKKDG